MSNAKVKAALSVRMPSQTSPPPVHTFVEHMAKQYQRLPISIIPQEYQKMYGKKLVYKGKFKDAIKTLPTVQLVKKGGECYAVWKGGSTTTSSSTPISSASQSLQSSKTTDEMIACIVRDHGRINLDQIHPEYNRRYGKVLILDCKLRVRVDKIPGVTLEHDKERNQTFAVWKDISYYK